MANSSEVDAEGFFMGLFPMVALQVFHLHSSHRKNIPGSIEIQYRSHEKCKTATADGSSVQSAEVASTTLFLEEVLTYSC